MSADGAIARRHLEACRVEPDREGLEQAILRRLKRGDGEGRETLIAWAILRTEP